MLSVIQIFEMKEYALRLIQQQKKGMADKKYFKDDADRSINEIMRELDWYANYAHNIHKKALPRFNLALKRI